MFHLSMQLYVIVVFIAQIWNIFKITIIFYTFSLVYNKLRSKLRIEKAPKSVTIAETLNCNSLS